MMGLKMTQRFTNKGAWEHFFKTLKYSLYLIVHPFDGFWDLKNEKRGSLAAANFIIFMMLLTRILALQHTNFMFMWVYWPRVNILQQCVSLLLPLGIFCLGNWGLTTLFDGKGTLREVYIATAYALVPYVLLNIPAIILSNLVTFEEGTFYYILTVFALIWSGFLIICGMTQTHDYAFGKTILFIIMSLFAMLVIIFLLVLFLNLVADGVAYFISLYREITFRLY